MEIKEQIGNKIKQYRESRGLSVSEAAQKAGVSEVAWYAFESGEYGMRVETLVAKVAPALEIPAALLLP